MKGKGLYIAAGVVLVLALGCLFTGEVQSFGGGVILAAALVAYSQWKKKHPVSKTSELHTIEGREGSKTIRETVSYFLIFPRKKPNLFLSVVGIARLGTLLENGTKKYTVVRPSLTALKRQAMRGWG